jgi:hypothetical protein
MSAFARWLVVACGCAATLASPAVAQTVRQDCRFDDVMGLTADRITPRWQEWHPAAAMARLRPLIDENRGEEVGRALRDLFAGSVANVPAAARAAHQAELGDYGRLLDSLALVLRGFTPLVDPVERLRQIDGLAADVPRDFAPRMSPEGEAEILRGEPGVHITLHDGHPSDLRRALCWSGMAAEVVINELGAPARTRTLAELDRLLGLWENFVDRGYSQFPWEVLLNRGDELRLEPPRWQRIFLHPSVGGEVSGDALSRLRRETAILIEVFGLLHYNASRTSYGGASAVASITEERTPAIGLLGHWNWVALGLLARRGETPERWRRPELGIVLSLDLYDLVSGVPAQYEATVQRIRRAATAN